MRKPERQMWVALRPVIKSLDPVRIESPLTEAGIPDVNYNKGWIELKYVVGWPKRGGPLKIEHFTKEQRGFLIRRKAAGGRAFFLLKVGINEWLLFDGSIAAISIGHLPQQELYKKTIARWLRKPKSEEIIPCLIK